MEADTGRVPLEAPTSEDTRVWDVWLSAFHFPALAVADELGVFAGLAGSPGTAVEVAERHGIGARGTEALLALLASLGFLAQRGGRFHLTNVARNFLLPDGPFYWGPMLRAYFNRPVTAAGLREALVKDRRLDAERITQAWEAGELTPEQAEAVTAAMHAHSFPAAMGVARHGDFAGVRRLLDVAGGSGCFCIALALRHPELRCTVMELAAVCPVTERYLAEFGVHGQVDTLARNMFTDPWPEGYDAVFFSNIFHDWKRERCLQLARKSFAALPPGGRICVHEVLLNDTKDGPLAAASFSTCMLVNTQGKQFSAGELDALLREAGFGEVRVTPTYGHYSLVTGVKTE